MKAKYNVGTKVIYYNYTDRYREGIKGYNIREIIGYQYTDNKFQYFVAKYTHIDEDDILGIINIDKFSNKKDIKLIAKITNFFKTLNTI